MRLRRRQRGRDQTQVHECGLTLIEVLVSMVISTIIMLAIGSSMIIAGRAMPQADCPANAVITTSKIAEQLGTEVGYAVAVNTYSDKVIEFTVADRDNNDVPETIRYEWSGVPGDPLTRQYNGGTTVNILDCVQEFNLTYELEMASEEIPQGNESGEMLMVSYYGIYDWKSYSIKDDKWYSQYFAPSLPADALSWKVTRVRFYARREGNPFGECRIQLQLPTSGNFPSGVVLEEKTLIEQTLFYWYTLQEFAYSNVSDLSPGQGLCLVIKWISDSDACEILARDEGVYQPNTKFLKSSDRGASWEVRDGESLLFRIYGTVTTTGEPQVNNTYSVAAVNIKLRTGDDEKSIVRSQILTLNMPEVNQ